MISNPIIALLVFILAYISFIVLPKRRSYVALIASLLIVAAGVISFKQAFVSVNWNVMGIFVGMLAVADVFMQSKVPAYFAEHIVNKAKTTGWAILFICLLTGFISAFVENVATVLIVAPIAIALSRKLNINPMNMMISIAISSNLQGAATLIGDPPSMLLGGYAKMNFMDFIFYQGKPGIFFAVEIGALASFLVLYFVFKSHKEKVTLILEEKVKSWFPTVLLVSLIIILALTSFVSEFSYASGIACMLFGIIAVVWHRLRNKESLWKSIRGLDWDTSFFLVGVFILVGSLTLTGWIDNISSYLSSTIGKNILLGYVVLVIISVVLSGFIDNVPFLAAMLPVAGSMSASLGISPSLFLFGLLIGASVGGNITPIGASANIVACGILRKEGITVKFRDFMRISVPFTIAAVGAAAIFLWFVWGP